MPADRVPLSGYERRSDAEMAERAETFYALMRTRRTVREFSPEPVPRRVIEAALRTAGSAPSGANLEPWRFVVVSDPAVKRRIREAAEHEERLFYEQRASDEWLAALEPLGVDADKPFLDTAPYLIAIFQQKWGVAPDGSRVRHYYPAESVGIATGLLIAALHHAGLATLTHTPSPMGFLNELLRRPDHEKPFLLLVVGRPAEGATVPDIQRKPLGEFVSFFETC